VIDNSEQSSEACPHDTTPPRDLYLHTLTVIAQPPHLNHVVVFNAVLCHELAGNPLAQGKTPPVTLKARNVVDVVWSL
jgi:hypothetical protein